jgi:hypothetical protein
MRALGAGAVAPNSGCAHPPTGWLWMSQRMGNGRHGRCSSPQEGPSFTGGPSNQRMQWTPACVTALALSRGSNIFDAPRLLGGRGARAAPHPTAARPGRMRH